MVLGAFLLIGFEGVVGAVSHPSITVDTPSTAQTVSNVIWVNATATDDGSIDMHRYRWQRGGSAKTPWFNQKAVNQTFDTATLENQDYNITFYANDTDGNQAMKKVGVFVDNGGGGDEPVDSSGLTLDDQKEATDTTYGNNIAFIGSDLAVSGGTSSNYFNLTTESGLLKSNVSGDQNFTTNDTYAEGRYTVWNQSSGGNTTVDLVSNTSDVTGRINASTALSGVEVKVYDWLGSSKIDASTTDNFNASSVEAWNGEIYDGKSAVEKLEEARDLFKEGKYRQTQHLLEELERRME